MVSGGTQNHACMIDLSGTEITANDAASALAKTGLICNANIIPFDAGTPVNPNGLRMGTAAVTTLGMKASHMKQIAEYVHATLASTNNPHETRNIANRVYELRAQFAYSQKTRATA